MSKLKIKDNRKPSSSGRSSGSGSSSSHGKSESSRTTDVGERPEISIHLNAGPPILKPIVDDDKRDGPRYKANFEAVCMYETVSFRTITVNISIAGILLKEPIPETLIKKPISLMLVHNMNGKRESLLFKAEALGAPLRSPRIRFIDLSEADKTKLEALFKKLPKA